MNLRDALLHGLANLPGTRRFHVHVLVSSPRKHSNLYPFATPRPKTFLQDILVLLSEQPTPDGSRVFVSAIEASLYHVPSTSSAVLYISKVDSTGQAKPPSPTSSLVRALATYYLDPTTRPLPVAHLWVHLFARAQNQYLFPNSSEYPGKRPLTDVALCAWWKRQLSTVANDVSERHEAMDIRLFYVLPGLGELEARHALDRVSASTSRPESRSVPWTYGHPYGQTEAVLPCCLVGRDEERGHIGHVIPWFDDDPKARFLDEIAYTTEAEGVRSPERKRARTSRAGRVEQDTEKKEGTCVPKTEQTSRALGKVSIEEFWERMSFRQECIAGAVTGFFVMCTTSILPCGRQGLHSPLAPLPGQVSSQMVKRVLSSLMTGHEFPTVERAVWSTRVLEDAIKGLCEGLKIVHGETQSPGESRAGTPEPQEDKVALPETPRARRGPVEADSPKVEPIASVETYDSYIYGAVSVRNAEEPRKGSVQGDGAGAITVLTARRKKRGNG